MVISVNRITHSSNFCQLSSDSFCSNKVAIFFVYASSAASSCIGDFFVGENVKSLVVAYRSNNKSLDQAIIFRYLS